MNTKILKGGVIAVLLVILFFWVVSFIENRSATMSDIATIATTTTGAMSDIVNTRFTYQDPAGTFSLLYPNDFMVKGSSFFVPASIATGTNLSKDSRIYVETKELAGTTTCENATSSDAGAGNFYETITYGTKASSSCIMLTLFIHSTNIANYDPGTIKEFERARLTAIFTSMLQSLKIK